MTGACRRPLSHDPWRFIDTSTRPSATDIVATPITNTYGAVAKPMTGSPERSNTPPPISVFRVPNRAISTGDCRLPSVPMLMAIVINTPRPPSPTPMRSRISGRRGTNEANAAPFTKNCTATDRSARRSTGENVALSIVGSEFTPERYIRSRATVHSPEAIAKPERASPSHGRWAFAHQPFRAHCGRDGTVGLEPELSAGARANASVGIPLTFDPGVVSGPTGRSRSDAVRPDRGARHSTVATANRSLPTGSLSIPCRRCSFADPHS